MMLKKNNKQHRYTTYVDRIKDTLEVNCYHIKAKDLKQMLGLSIGEIDEVLSIIIDIPIKKYRKNLTTYYMFPIELLIADYIFKNVSSVKF